MPRPKQPVAVNLVNEWLKAQPEVTAICGKRIDVTLPGQLPAIRLTNLGPIDRGPEEVYQRVQVECWAHDYDTATDLALNVEAAVPDSRGTWAAGTCAGGEVESGPFDSPDPESEKYRVQLDVGLWIYPKAPAVP